MPDEKVVDPKEAALAVIEDLTYSDCLNFFETKATPRDKQIADMVDTDDDLEVDWAIISEGDANGAFVLSWSWVDFSGTELSKICAECDEGDTEKVVTMRNGKKKPLCKACLEESSCPDCQAIEGTEEWGTVGDGFDGYCPSCTDKHAEGDSHR